MRLAIAVVARLLVVALAHAVGLLAVVVVVIVVVVVAIVV